MAESAPRPSPDDPTELLRWWADGLVSVTQRTDGDKSWFGIRNGQAVVRALEDSPETTTVLLPGETVVVHSDTVGERLAANRHGRLELHPYSDRAIAELESEGFTILFAGRNPD